MDLIDPRLPIATLRKALLAEPLSWVPYRQGGVLVQLDPQRVCRSSTRMLGDGRWDGRVKLPVDFAAGVSAEL
jgi:hypothetical protein